MSPCTIILTLSQSGSTYYRCDKTLGHDIPESRFEGDDNELGHEGGQDGGERFDSGGLMKKKTRRARWFICEKSTIAAVTDRRESNVMLFSIYYYLLIQGLRNTRQHSKGRSSGEKTRS